MEGAVPINTFVRQSSPTSIRDGLHVMKTFAGVTCGVLQSALAAGYKVRMYTYVDRDPISRKMAWTKLRWLQSAYPTLLMDATVQAFDKRLSQNISLVGPLFLGNLVVRHGLVDLLGGSWECQSVNKAGEQRGMADPRFIFFYNLVRITKKSSVSRPPLFSICLKTHGQVQARQMRCARLARWCRVLLGRPSRRTRRGQAQPRIAATILAEFPDS